MNIQQGRQRLLAGLRTGRSILIDEELEVLARQLYALEVLLDETALAGAEEVVADGRDGLHAACIDDVLGAEGVEPLVALLATMVAGLATAREARAYPSTGRQDDDVARVRREEHPKIVRGAGRSHAGLQDATLGFLGVSWIVPRGSGIFLARASRRGSWGPAPGGINKVRDLGILANGGDGLVGLRICNEAIEVLLGILRGEERLLQEVQVDVLGLRAAIGLVVVQEMAGVSRHLEVGGVGPLEDGLRKIGPPPVSMSHSLKGAPPVSPA